MMEQKIKGTIIVETDQASVNKSVGALKKITDTLRSMSSIDVKEFMNLSGIKDTDKAKAQLEKVRQSAEKVGAALTVAFNPKLNTFNVQQFNQELKKSGLSVKELNSLWTQLGTQGQLAFTQVGNAITQTQNLARKTTGVFDKLGESMANTIRWKITSGLLNNFTGSIQQAWGYAKALDTSLNNIRIVTGKSAEEMERFAKSANKTAKSLSASTTAYTDAALIYYQQGLGDKEAQTRAAITVKAANVTGQSAAEVSEQLTAVWNGYKVVAEEAELYVDKLAAVAASTAADLEELSDGMSKVASAANAMGVDIDQLSAQLATIVSVTRQDAASVGTALKTIFARMGDLKVDGVDEFGVSLGDVSGQMKQMGIDVLDQQGNLRDMGDVIEEVAAKWGTWTDAQQQAAAVAMAGKRQYNNLIALFENWDMYESSLATSQGAEGTLEKQNKTYQESIKAMMQELKTAGEGVKGALFDAKSVEEITNVLKGFLFVIEHLVTAMGGLKNILPFIFAMLMTFNKSFSGNLTKGIYDIGASVAGVVKQGQYFKATQDNLKQMSAYAGKYKGELENIYNIIMKLEKAHQSGFFSGEEGEEEYRQRMASANAAKSTLENDLVKRASAESIMGVSLEELQQDQTGATYQRAQQQTEESSASYNASIDQVLLTGSALERHTNWDSGKPTEQVQALKTALEDLSKQKGLSKESIASISEFSQRLETSITNIDEQKAALKQLEDILNEVDEQYKVVSGTAQAALAGSTPGVESMMGVSMDALRQDQSGDVKQKALENIDKNERSFNTAKEAVDGQIAAATKTLSSGNALSTEDIAGLNQALNELSKQPGVSKDCIQSLDDFSQQLENGSQKVVEQQEAIKKLQDQLAKLETQYEETTEAAKKAADTPPPAADPTKNPVYQNNKAGAKDGPGKVPTGTLTKIQEVGSMIGAVMGAVSAVNMLTDSIINLGSNSGSVFDNIMGLVMGVGAAVLSILPILATGVTLLSIISIVAIAVIAVLTIVITLVAKFVDRDSEYDKANKKLEAMNKTLAEMKASAIEARESYAELKAEIADYRNARKGIDELLAGTEEWENAIDDLNLQVLKLIDTYEGLELVREKLYGKIVYGIDSDSIDNVLAAKQDEIQRRTEAVAAYELQVDEQTLQTKLFSEHYKQEWDNQGNPSVDNMEYNQDLRDVLAMSYDEALNALAALEEEQKDENGILRKIYEEVVRVRRREEKHAQDYIRIFAEGKNIDEDIFANLAGKPKTPGVAKDIRGDSINFSETEDKTDFVRNQGFNRLTKVVLNDDGTIKLDEDGDIVTKLSYRVGGKIQTGDVHQVQDWLDNLAEAAYGPDATITNYGNVKGKATNELGSVEIELKDYGKMTIDELRQAVMTTATRQAMEAENEALIAKMEEYRDAGKKQEAVYFNSDLNKAATEAGKLDPAEEAKIYNDAVRAALEKDEDLTLEEAQEAGEAAVAAAKEAAELNTIVDQYSTGTLADYNEIASYGGPEGETAEAAREVFINRAVGLLEQAGFNIDEDTFKEQYNQLTMSQIKGIQNAVSKAELYGGGGAIRALITNETNAAKKALLADYINSTDFSNTDSVTQLQSKLVEMGYDINDGAWKDFFNNVNSGMEQWVQNSEKVRENLAFIKNTLADIEIGGTISDEDYQQLISIRPDLAKSFIRSSDGWVSTLSGKTLAAEGSSKYSDLAGLKEHYSDIRTNAQGAIDSGVQMGDGSEAETKAQLANYFGAEIIGGGSGIGYVNLSRLRYLSNLLGVYPYHIQKLLYASVAGATEEEQNNAVSELKNLAQKADSLIIKAQSGQLDDADAVSQYVTSTGDFGTALSTYMENQTDFDADEQEGWLRYFSSWLVDEMEAVSSQYREFIVKERTFWEQEFAAWQNLENGELPTVEAALADPTISQKMGVVDAQATGFNESIALGLHALANLDPEEQSEDFLEQYGNVQDFITEYKGLAKELESLWIDAIDEIFDLYDKTIERYENLNSILSESSNLIQLVGYDLGGTVDAYDTIKSFQDTMSASAQFSYQAALEKQAQARIIYEDAMREDANISKEMREAAIEGYEAATEELMAAASQWVEVIKEAFSTKTTAAINQALKDATGYGYSDMSQAWELEKAIDDRYLDEVNKTYSIDEFKRKIQKSIDETDNLAAQQKLNDLRERELKILEQKGKLTQYDLDRANAEYELELKRIALEESQQTANKMQLARDAMGNYTYQYVQDKDAIAEAEAELAEAQNNLYNLDKDRKKELIDEWFSLMSEYEEKMSEAMATGNENLQNSVYDYYFGASGMLTALQEELSVLGLSGIFDGTTDRILKVKVSGEDGLDATMSGIVTEFKDAFSNVQSAISEAFGEGGALTTAIDGLKGNLELDVSNIKTAFNSISNGEDGAADILIANMGSLSEKIEEYIGDINTYLGDLEKYKEQANNIVNSEMTELEANTKQLSTLNGTLGEIDTQLKLLNGEEPSGDSGGSDKKIWEDFRNSLSTGRDGKWFRR